MIPAVPPYPPVPANYRGPLHLATGRMVWWTGRVAVGLRYQAPTFVQPSNDELFLQDLLRRKEPHQ